MKNNYLLISILLAITVAAFWPSLFNGFTDWDDNRYISANPLIRELSGDNIKTMFTRVITGEGHYHPLTFLSFALEYHFFKLDPFIYHLDNLLLHLLNSVLMYCFILNLARCPITAFITAILFAIHPMHVESVAWLPERKDVLSNAFYIGALLVYVRWKDGFIGSRKGQLAVAILFVAALLSKPSAVTLPLILLCCDFYRAGKITLRAIFEKLPLLAMSLIFGMFALSQKASADIAYSFSERLMFAGTALWIYLLKVLYPFELSAFYDFPMADQAGYGAAIALAPWVGAFFVLSVLYIFRKNKDIIFGLFVFLATILPVLGIIRFSNYLLAERYTYFAYTGLFFILARTFVTFITSTHASSFLKRFTILLVVFFIGMCAWLTHWRCPVWNNALALWNDVVAKNPHSAFAYANRGAAYLNRGHLEESYQDLTRAIALDPNLSIAFINRGNLLVQAERLQDALADYDNAALLDPTAEGVYINRGMAYGRLKQFEKALADLNHAIAQNPGSAHAHLNLGSVYFDMGEYERAVQEYSAALAIDPHMIAAYYGRGLALARMGKTKESEEDLLKASQHYKM